MTPWEMLRTRFGIDGGRGPHAPTVNDEQILNVLRRELEKEDGKEELTTPEIADELPLGDQQTHNRLEDMKDERVKKRRAGQTDMWRLASGEPETVMNPDLGTVIEQSSRARRWEAKAWESGKDVSIISFALLFLGVTAWVAEFSVPFISWQTILSTGYLVGILGAALLEGGAVLRILGIYTPSLFERLLLQ